MQSTALTTFLQDSKNANLNIQSAVCGQLNNIPFDSSLVINGRRPSFMGIEKSNGMMVVISNWLSHPNLSPTDGWCLARAKIGLRDRQTPPFNVCTSSIQLLMILAVQVLVRGRAGSLITGGPSALFADFQFECPCSYQSHTEGCSIESEALQTNPAFRLYHLLPTMIAGSPPSLNLLWSEVFRSPGLNLDLVIWNTHRSD